MKYIVYLLIIILILISTLICINKIKENFEEEQTSSTTTTPNNTTTANMITSYTTQQPLPSSLSYLQINNVNVITSNIREKDDSLELLKNSELKIDISNSNYNDFEIRFDFKINTLINTNIFTAYDENGEKWSIKLKQSKINNLYYIIFSEPISIRNKKETNFYPITNNNYHRFVLKFGKSEVFLYVLRENDESGLDQIINFKNNKYNDFKYMKFSDFEGYIKNIQLKKNELCRFNPHDINGQLTSKTHCLEVCQDESSECDYLNCKNICNNCLDANKCLYLDKKIIKAPKAPKIKALPFDKKIVVQWLNSNLSYNDSITNFIILIRDKFNPINGVKIINVDSVNKTGMDYTINGLKNQVVYEISIKSVDNNGVSKESNKENVAPVGEKDLKDISSSLFLKDLDVSNDLDIKNSSCNEKQGNHSLLQDYTLLSEIINNKYYKKNK
jgi:hypothetical protein